MAAVADILRFLGEYAPVELAEDWDNVGLLLGDAAQECRAAMTCLTLTPDVAAEAIAEGAQLVVTHHPILFQPVQQITTATAEGRMLLELIAAGVAVYSPHTAYDSARDGINQQLAERLELREIGVLRAKPLSLTTAVTGSPASETAPLGAGRCGTLPQPMALANLLGRIKQQLRLERLQYVGDPPAMIERVGIACGSAAEFLPDAHRVGCQALLTGEARFHACLQARELGMAMILVGHYASERPAVERLAETLARQFPAATVWASRRETDPVQWM